MLAQLVRPLVRTQIQLLAQTQSASAKLVSMISQWLGYLGVRAEVNQLRTNNGKIQLSLTVSRPEQCTEDEWRQILSNISQNHGTQGKSKELTYAQMTGSQQSKVHRLLAHVIQAGSPDTAQSWDEVYPHLAEMGLDATMLLGIQSAMKVPTNLDLLLEGLDTEVAAFVLSRAISVALLDRQINPAEDSALKALYEVLQHQAKA